MSWDKNRKRVQFYNELIGKLERPKQSKVRKFIDHECIKPVGPGEYVCNPLEHYNTTPHKLILMPFRGEYRCSCQGWRTYGKCSHIDALNIILKIEGKTPEPSLFPAAGKIP